VDASRCAIAAEILAAAREHDERQADRLDRFRNVEPETAELLGVLTRATRAQAILEIGTSNGYSTIWLADAGGAVISVDIDAERTELACANLARAGVEAELRTEDAAETLAAAADGAYDLIFLDSERPAYPAYWPELLRILRPDGGLLVIDNVISHAHEVVEITALIAAEAAVSSVLVEIGAGILLVTRCG
jgi:predicted O-methyltransferase YrrM